LNLDHVRNHARAKRSIRGDEQFTVKQKANDEITLHETTGPYPNVTLQNNSLTPRKRHGHHHRTTSLLKKNKENASNDAFNQLLGLVDSLQKRVIELQSEVRRLHHKLNERD